MAREIKLEIRGQCRRGDDESARLTWLTSTPPCQKRADERTVWIVRHRTSSSSANDRHVAVREIRLRCHVSGHIVVELNEDTMNESRRRQKWAESFNSFVKMSALLIMPGMCFTWICPSTWASRTRFSWRLTCLIPFVVTVDDLSTHAWLSL